MVDVNRNNLVSIALCAVLAFYMLYPVSGFQKPEKAHAVAPAVAAITIFGTACTAAGIYIAGSTITQYNGNLNTFYQGFQDATDHYSASWSAYVQDQGSFDNAMQSCLTESGQISLQTLTDNGFFDSVNSYSAYCVDEGILSEGTSSLDCSKSLSIGGVLCNSGDITAALTKVQNESKNYYNEVTSAGYIYPVAGHYLVSGNRIEAYVSFSKVMPAVATVSSGQVTINDVKTIWRTTVGSGASSSRSNMSKTDNLVLNSSWVVSPDATFVDSNGNASEQVPSNTGVYDSEAASTPQTATVDPMAVTNEMLQQGIDSASVIEADVHAIESTTSDLYYAINDVLGGHLSDIVGLLSPLAGIAVNVQTIRDTITTFPEWVENISDTVTGIPETLAGIADGITTLPADITAGISGLIEGVPAWIQTIHDVVIGLPDAIGGVASDVVSGVSTWWESLLQWLGDTPLAALIGSIISAISAGVTSLSDAIAAIQAWISDAVGELVGAIEGVIESLPFGYERPTSEGEPVRVPGLPPAGYDSNLDAMLHEKEPFCYFFEFVDALAGVNYSQNTSFHVQHEFQLSTFRVTVPVDINLEPYLNRDLGGTTIAYLLRMSTTMCLVMGICYGAYKTALRTLKGA